MDQHATNLRNVRSEVQTKVLKALKNKMWPKRDGILHSVFCVGQQIVVS
jgi:hypothetical protein